jgi:hypothetical protein
MNEAPQVLIVPIELSALPVGLATRSVAHVAHDFNIENPKPWLGQNTEPRLFETGQALQPGVHLHWSLPDALTHGPMNFVVDASVWQTLAGQGFPKELAQGLRGQPELASATGFETRHELDSALLTALDGLVGAEHAPPFRAWVSSAVPGKTRFPTVPNRWRVTRYDMDKPHAIPRSWVVESDLLWDRSPEETDAQNLLSPTVPHLPDALSDRYHCVLGKAFPGETWQEQPRDNTARHQPHTAVGYGHPAFAAALPHCYNVFGLYDPLDDEDGPALRAAPSQLAYAVVGWYSNADDDPAPRAAQMGWDSAKADGTTAPDRSGYCGLLLKVSWSPEGLAPHPSKPVQVAVGNSTAEALSALLARQPAMQKLPGAERHLNALQFGLLANLEAKRPGVLKVWDELLHQKDFGATAGGTNWVLKQQSQAVTAAATPDADRSLQQAARQMDLPIPEALIASLNELNAHQTACDRLHNDIDSLRAQLFADWCNYLLILHDQSLLTMADIRQRDDALNQVEPVFQGALDTIGVQQTSLADAISKRDRSMGKLTKVLDEWRLAAEAQRRDYRLQAVGAPRYWQANEPVVVICGEDARPARSRLPTRKAAAGGAARLICRLMAGDSISDCLATLAQETVAGVYPPTPAVPVDSRIASQQWATPWRPLMMQWEVEFHASADPAHDYDTQTIVEKMHFDARHPIDLGFPPLRLNPNPDLYAGAALLAGNAEINLVEQAKAYLKNHPAVPDAPHRQRVRDQLAALVAMPSLPLQSQTLSGFNAALLARRQCLQLPVIDPNAPSDGEFAFGAAIRAGVAGKNNTSPLTDADLNPLRSGHLQIKRLWLVDTFGQVVVVLGPAEVADLRNPHAIETGDIVRAHGYTDHEADPARPLLALRPRLAQPARLHLDWLAGADDQAETGSHTAASPVLGWILANHLEDSLALYSPDGSAIGSFQLQGELWQGAPGPLYGKTIEQAIAPGHLLEFALGLSTGGRDFLRALIAAINDMTPHVLPHAHRQHRGVSLLIGRPLALVRAGLKLELLGQPAVDQGLAAFQQWLCGRPRNDRGIGAVEFPVRLGHKGYLNDGLIGYFIEQPDKAKTYQTFYVEAHSKTDGKGVAAPSFQQLTVTAGAKQGRIVTMLVDPRAPVHATTGILPVKQLLINPEFVAAPLARMAVSFAVTPVFSPRTAPAGAAIGLPVPAEAGYTWTLLRRGAALGDWPEQAVTAVNHQADFSNHPQRLLDGWLQLRPAPGKPQID